jgi:hypothetical protein
LSEDRNLMVYPSQSQYIKRTSGGVGYGGRAGDFMPIAGEVFQEK